MEMAIMSESSKDETSKSSMSGWNLEVQESCGRPPPPPLPLPPLPHPPILLFFFYLLTSISGTISAWLSSFTTDHLTLTGNSNLNMFWNTGPTCHFYSADSSWQSRGTTADWGFMRGSLSDDSAGRMESCDVMETRPLTDTSQQVQVVCPDAGNHSYPRSMSGAHLRLIE